MRSNCHGDGLTADVTPLIGVSDNPEISTPTTNTPFRITISNDTVEEVSTPQQGTSEGIMSTLLGRMGGVITATAVASSLVFTAPVIAAVSAQGAKFTVSTTVKGGKNLVVLLMSATGRTLASQKITKASQKISLKTPLVSQIAGATLQLVSGSSAAGKGQYFGPVVLGWKGTKASSASKVYTKLSTKASKTVSLGTMTVKGSSGGSTVTAIQGYAVVSKSSKVANSSTAAQVSSSKGKPLGVGTYGKNGSVSVKEYGVSATAVGDPCSTPGVGNCGANGQELAPLNPGGATTTVPGSGGGTPTTVPGSSGGTPTTVPGSSGGTPTTVPGSGGGTPSSGGGTPSSGGGTPDSDETLGGDADDDGIPNAFDVNDDGDTILDSADKDTPAPQVAADNGTSVCSAVDFKIFTNLKATQPGFAGTINAYGVGEFKATREKIASTISNTMSMVFSPITEVCESKVTRTWLKGVGAAYAPSDYVELSKVCNNTGDYQWAIGLGRMCSSGSDGYDFGTKYTFSGTDLPSGQDTFSMKVETADGKTYEFTSSPGFVFVTHPMILSYSTNDTTFTTIDYTKSTAGPDGTRLTTDPVIELTKTQGTMYLKIYRPQRLAFNGETGDFYDLGAFKYTPDIPNGSPSVGKCDATTTTDTELTSDTAINEAAPPTLKLTWNLTKCFNSLPKNVAWPTSSTQSDFDIQVEPSGPGGNSAQKVRMTLS